MTTSPGSDSGFPRIFSSSALAKASSRSRSIGTFLVSVLLIAGCDSPAGVGIDAHASLSLAPANASVDEGHTLEFRVVSGTSSATVGTASSFSWQSSNPAVATVQNGVVTARGMGEATITASAPSGTFARGALRVTRSAEEIVPTRGDRQESVVGLPLETELEVQVLSGAGNPVSGSTIEFAVAQGGGSVSTVVARTDQDGIARTFWELGPIAGNQRVEVRSTDRPEVSSFFTALARPDVPERIEVRPRGVTLQRGTQFVFGLVVEDRFGNVVGSAPVTWESEDPEIARVDGEGRVVSLSGGETVITATLTGGPGGFAAAFGDPATAPGGGNGRALGRVKVEDTEDSADPGASLSIISGDGQTGVVGELLPEALEVWVMDDSGDPIRNRNVTWTVRSGGGEVVNASSKTNGHGRASAGWVLGTSIGDGSVEVHVDNIGGVTFQATALAGPLAAVTLTPASASVTVGAEQPFEITATDAYGNPLQPSSTPTWSVVDPSVATISTTGWAKGKAAGSTQVIATVAGVEGTAALHVEGDAQGEDGESKGAISSISLSPASSSMTVGSSLQIEATVKDQDGNQITPDDLVWASSDSSVAAVDGNGKGAAVSALSSGSATVTATVDGVTGSSSFTVSSTSSVDGQVPAFPGAEGWGATALNECRSLPVQVLAVTNRNSSGAGSLDQAIQDIRSDRFTFIVFRTGGHITMPAGGTRLNGSCVYLAGQTAPGDGIVIEGDGTALWFRGGGSNIHDIVMRHMRFRGRAGRTRNNLVIAKGDRIVLDHMSFSWTDNYVLALIRYGGSSTSAPISNVSIQNTIVSEAFATHPTGLQIGSNSVLKYEPTIETTNLSLHRNLLAHNSHRNPQSGADNALYANNVLYNWNQGTMQMTMRGTTDYVNNVGKRGPMTSSRYMYMVNPRCDDNVVDDFSIYAAGNIGPMSQDPNGDNWSGSTRQVACYYKSGDTDGQEVPARWKRGTTQSWGSTSFPVQVRSASNAFDAVLNSVGANAGLTCDGQWTDRQDVVDARVISETRNGTGPSTPPADEGAAGGYPSYAAGTVCKDSDGDGLPDAWETRFFGCATCATPDAVGRDGYLVMEHYLNGTTP
jgi:pectate lyase